MNNNYNPHTKPVWLSLMPVIMGIMVVVGVIVAIAYGASLFNEQMSELKEMAGQYLGACSS